MARIQLASIALSVFLGGSPLAAANGPALATVLEPENAPAPALAGWLGVLLAQDAERPTVAEVIPGSPAESAGLRPGDVFLGVGDARVSSIDDLQRLLGDAAAGADVVLVLERGGDKIEVQATLGERPPEGLTPGGQVGERRAPPPKPAATETRRLQREVRQDPVQEGTGRAYLGVSVSESKAGVKIEAVVEGSPAERGGLRAGDLIRAFEGREIGNLEDLDRAMGRVRPGQRVRVDVQRGERARDLEVELGRVGQEAEASPPKKGETKQGDLPLPVPVVKVDQGRQIEAELQAAREQMEKARASMDLELRQAQEQNAREMQRAQRQMEEARAEFEVELQRARQDIDRERERAQSEMNKERQSFEKELQRARQQAEEEAGRWRKEMDRERRAMGSEMKKARKEVEQEMRQAERQMNEERQQLEREINRGRKEAEKEMQDLHRAFAKEREEMERELHRGRDEAEKEIGRQRQRVAEELQRARDEMDHERRRISNPEQPREPHSSPRSGGAATADLEKRLGGMRREFERIRSELRELQVLLEKKRR